jgi:ATP-dependent helicase/nuclease subunit A
MDLVTALDQCATLAGEETCDLDRLATALLATQVKTGSNGPGGRKGNWHEALGGKDELLACYRCVADGIVALRDEYALHVTGLAVAVADAFARWAGGVQLELGRLDFTDLLGQLRDLLVHDLAARRSLQERFGYLLVDEFQDTDPLQAESVVLLCEHEPLARDWRDVVLAPGKLFVVGDPKQSIYRFRRADISLYDEVKELVRSQPRKQGEVLAIAQNFRATPALVGWANNVFGDIFDAEQEVGRQPGYQWVEAYRPPAPGARVAVLLGREYGRQAGESDAARRDEARALAGLLLEICGGDGEEWTVCDRARSTPGDEVTRPARWGDVALLVRATTGLETYEQTLREAGVPYRVEGGKTYFQRREVTDVLLCLRAIDDPSDGPAVYGALHSSLFGFSDDDLFLFWAAGGTFEPGVATQPEGQAAVAAALGVLWGLHERRRVCETHELIEELLRATQAEEFQAATGAAAGQALANLEKLVERARAFTGAGGGGLGAFLAWAAEAEDAAGERESQVDDDGDVVHLLTIHGAKGLEWPIVVLAGAAMAGSGGHGRTVEPIVDRRRRRVVVKLKADLPGATRDLIPRAYEELIEYEKGMARSEARRLLYVALTRARDRLVVSCFGRLENAKGEATAALLGPLHQLLPAPGSVSARHEREGLLVLVPEAPRERPGRAETPDVPALRAARGAWMRGRDELLARAARSARATSPSALEQVDDAVRIGGAGAPPGRARALALGAAVHRVLELCDLNDAASLAPLAERAAAELGRPDLAGRVAELAAVCWRATPVRAAARSAAVHRELVVGALVGDTIVKGAVDLLYRDGESWVVVDYKTDRATDAVTFRARYEPQGAAYALAVEAAVGEPVREVVFVAAAAAGLEIVVPVSDELRERARRAVAAAGAHGVAVARDELCGEA